MLYLLQPLPDPCDMDVLAYLSTLRIWVLRKRRQSKRTAITQYMTQTCLHIEFLRGARVEGHETGVGGHVLS